MGSSGAVRGTASLVLNTAPLAAGVIPAAVTEGINGSSGVANLRRARKNLTANSRWRIVVRVSTAATGTQAKAAFQWSLDQSTWVWADGVASGSAPGANAYVSMATAAAVSSSWIPIPAAARADIWLRTVTLDGDGVATGSVAQFVIETE